MADAKSMVITKAWTPQQWKKTALDRAQAQQKGSPKHCLGFSNYKRTVFKEFQFWYPPEPLL